MTPEPIAAYGMQREFCLRATLDEAGHPRRPPVNPVWDAFHLHGDLHEDHFRTALRLVTEAVDVFTARLRGGADGFRFVPEDGAAAVSVEQVDLRGCAGDRHRARLGLHLMRSYTPLIDMQDGPLAAVTLIREADDRHVLAMAIDHTVADQQSMAAILRTVGRVYQALLDGDPAQAARAARTPSFLAYARSVAADRDGLAETDRFWAPALAEPPPRVTFPGGGWKPWQQRQATGNHFVALPLDEGRALTDLGARTGASLAHLFQAAVSLALLAAFDGEFLPVTAHRHGRVRATLRLPGPLWETLITRPPAADATGGTVGDWVAGFVAANAGAPPLRSRALVDYATLDTVMELRRVTVNVYPTTRPIPIGPLRAVPLPNEELAAARPHPIHQRTVLPHNTGLRLFALRGGRLEVALHHDPEDLPDAEVFLAVIRRAATVLTSAADLPLQQWIKEAGQTWGSG
ncbi:condensation domain-containing protein [Micromonospora fluostatini]|uniref:condensation domain-containing protein n=1 Tax=Micromonospora sp. JCM 30529 TaxID=3421643 RepID=UPI003D18726B